jgi:predicted ATP-grasp superfamily ATP-dependent carboligase
VHVVVEVEVVEHGDDTGEASIDDTRIAVGTEIGVELVGDVDEVVVVAITDRQTASRIAKARVVGEAVGVVRAEEGGV